MVNGGLNRIEKEQAQHFSLFQVLECSKPCSRRQEGHTGIGVGADGWGHEGDTWVAEGKMGNVGAGHGHTRRVRLPLAAIPAGAAGIWLQLGGNHSNAERPGVGKPHQWEKRMGKFQRKKKEKKKKSSRGTKMQHEVKLEEIHKFHRKRHTAMVGKGSGGPTHPIPPSPFLWVQPLKKRR